MPRPRTKNYLNDNDLVYEIILSKGKGFLTTKAIIMLIKLAKHMITTKQYYDLQNKDDAYQAGIEMVLKNWHNFNHKKYYKAMPYFTEVFKRGMALGFNEITNGDRGRKTISINGFESIWI